MDNNNKNNNVFCLYRIAQLVYRNSSHYGPENVFTDGNYMQKQIENTKHVLLRNKCSFHVSLIMCLKCYNFFYDIIISIYFRVFKIYFSTVVATFNLPVFYFYTYACSVV